MAGNRPKYYWDSCVFIAHLKKERDKYPVEVPIIEKLMASNSIADNAVIGSQLVRIEVLEWELTAPAKKSFDAFYSQGDNLIWDVDGRVATIAREIRDYYKENPIMVGKGEQKNPRGIKTPDAIHLATAILHKVDVFHTLDNGGQDGFSLLKLGDRVANKFDLKIEKPTLNREGEGESTGDEKESEHVADLFDNESEFEDSN